MKKNVDILSAFRVLLNQYKKSRWNIMWSWMLYADTGLELISFELHA